ncbi:MAG: zinc ribbon domain-containing protein [Anaerolineae bacterium]|nr:zinc ribbon domain-containing protein [Anaerolineae bacterium]
MPIYVYQCDDCGVTFERRQSIAATPLTDCPDCGGQVHRVIQPVGIVFKGSGFYVTDNRSPSATALPGEKKATTETGSDTAKSSEASSTKTEKTEKTTSTTD